MNESTQKIDSPRELDIFSLPLYYIAFSPSEEIEAHYREHGFKNINHFQAVDGRKMDPEELLSKGMISIRSYDDLKFKRVQHSGIPTLGCIGCSLSHYALWNHCLDHGFPFIIITEADNRMFKLLPKDLVNINTVLSRPNSVFNSVKIKRRDHIPKSFYGTNFYIASAGACKKLISSMFFPIDVQVDWYMSNLTSHGVINLDGYPVSQQITPLGASTIQTDCPECDGYTCNANKYLYLKVLCIVLVIIVVIQLVVIVRKNR